MSEMTLEQLLINLINREQSALAQIDAGVEQAEEAILSSGLLSAVANNLIVNVTMRMLSEPHMMNAHLRILIYNAFYLGGLMEKGENVPEAFKGFLDSMEDNDEEA